MASTSNHAASNALRIAGELSPIMGFEHFLQSPTAPLFSQVTMAAAVLAEIESAPDFSWNEGGRGDWETVCSRIAARIHAQKPVNRAAVMRLTRKAFRA